MAADHQVITRRVLRTSALPQRAGQGRRCLADGRCCWYWS